MVEFKKQNSSYAVAFKNDKYIGNGLCTINDENNYNFNISISADNEYIGNINYSNYNNSETMSYNCSRKYVSEFIIIIDEIINGMVFE
ncbi:MAG: hypothetical protein K2L48_04235 [Mycoplasmoidaceae bacterium]|nr:hypothetical protein [Mycoplasmoidaceae bacterium]